MEQILVEMRAPEFFLENGIESEPGETRLQLASLRRIRQICSGKSGAAHPLHRTHPRARAQ
jgi:hypothetical protein